jgi:hypothetical protein
MLFELCTFTFFTCVHTGQVPVAARLLASAGLGEAAHRLLQLLYQPRDQKDCQGQREGHMRH